MMRELIMASSIGSSLVILERSLGKRQTNNSLDYACGGHLGAGQVLCGDGREGSGLLLYHAQAEDDASCF
eukprot:4677221-Ditylum_brightwellii.AAC.1